MYGIRNVQFVPFYDEGYREYVQVFVDKQKRHRLEEPFQSPKKGDPVQDASRLMERLLRLRLGESDPERVIRYESFDGCKWSPLYVECDYVKSTSDGLVIGEIKGSESSFNLRKGHKQLKRAYELLEEELDVPIQLRLDVVDYSETATFRVRMDDYKDVGIRVEYHPVDELLSLADDLGLSYDRQIIAQARQSVMERKIRTGIARARRMEAVANKPEKTQTELSDFAVLLQQAIQVVA